MGIDFSGGFQFAHHRDMSKSAPGVLSSRRPATPPAPQPARRRAGPVFRGPVSGGLNAQTDTGPLTGDPRDDERDLRLPNSLSDHRRILSPILVRLNSRKSHA